MEDYYIRAIEAGIRKLKLKGWDGDDELLEIKRGIGRNLNKLKEVNEGMYEDLMNQYKKVLVDLN